MFFEWAQLYALLFRPFGTLTLLSTLMGEVVKILMTNNSEEEAWSWEARDILLDAWTALLVVYVFFSSKYAFNYLFVMYKFYLFIFPCFIVFFIRCCMKYETEKLFLHFVFY